MAASSATTARAAQALRPHGQRLSEETLSVIWEGQRFPPDALRLTDGRRLRVVYRGRREGGAGPDFRDAVIAIEREGLRYGDVELHARAGDWHSHGHDGDAAYGNVILHVVFDPAGTPAYADDGNPIPTLALGDWAVRRAGELAAWLSGPDHWREPCHEARANLGDLALRAAVKRLGVRRLRERAASLEALLRQPGAPPADQLLHVAIYEGLGYPRNREPFRRLASVYPWSRLRAELLVRPAGGRTEVAEALLLTASGLLAREGAVPASRRMRLLRLTSALEALPALPAGAWRRTAIRPGNRPERRLAGAAALADRFAQDGPIAALAVAAEQSAEALIDALTVTSEPEWGGTALIGRGRAIEVATNAVLPLLLALAQIHHDRRGSRLWEERFLALPRAEPYGRTAALERALNAGGRSLVNGTAGQQALLYLQEHYCSRGKCGRCPVSR